MCTHTWIWGWGYGLSRQLHQLPWQLCNPSVTHPLHWKHPETHPLIDRLSRVMVYKYKHCSRKYSDIPSPSVLFWGELWKFHEIGSVYSGPAQPIHPHDLSRLPIKLPILTRRKLENLVSYLITFFMVLIFYGIKSKEIVEISIYIHEQSMTLPSVDFADTT